MAVDPEHIVEDTVKAVSDTIDDAKHEAEQATEFAAHTARIDDLQHMVEGFSSQLSDIPGIRETADAAKSTADAAQAAADNALTLAQSAIDQIAKRADQAIAATEHVASDVTEPVIDTTRQAASGVEAVTDSAAKGVEDTAEEIPKRAHWFFRKVGGH